VAQGDAPVAAAGDWGHDFSRMTATSTLSKILVVPAPGDRRRGMILAGALHASCALGRTGIAQRKCEGDGGTPAGSFPVVAVLYRPDRVRRPRTALPVTIINPDSGWCDDPADPGYNQPVRLPYAASHERLWRADRLYDIVVILDYNLSPAIPGAGSAIFLHIAREDFAPTEGCVGIAPETMRRLLPRLGSRTRIVIP
jgi:L,D-peptidoglycan transpeptidase YkuD (ErfK/YbiS/YcfS/YnhG family)